MLVAISWYCKCSTLLSLEYGICTASHKGPNREVQKSRRIKWVGNASWVGLLFTQHTFKQGHSTARSCWKLLLWKALLIQLWSLQQWTFIGPFPYLAVEETSAGSCAAAGGTGLYRVRLGYMDLYLSSYRAVGVTWNVPNTYASFDTLFQSFRQSKQFHWNCCVACKREWQYSHFRL